MDFAITRRLGVPFEICLLSFAQGAPIEVVVTRPDGSQSVRLVRHDPEYSFPSWTFLAYPPEPVGLYRVVATQGTDTATGTFTVRAPHRPSVEPLRASARVGTPLPFVLAGFNPRENVAIYLYRFVGDARRTRMYSRAGHPARLIRVDQQGFVRGNVTMRRRGRYLLAAGALPSTRSVDVW